MSEVYRLDNLKVEVINGKKIVMMAPAYSNHNMVKNNVFHVFKTYLKGNICLPFGDGEKVVLEEDGYVIPDFFVLCDRSKYKRGGVYGAPDLVAEVLSPSTGLFDRGVKKDLYQRAGVKEYWIIDPDARSVEIYLLKNNTYVLSSIYRIPAEYESPEDKVKEPSEFAVGLFPDFIVSLSDIFEHVMDWA